MPTDATGWGCFWHQRPGFRSRAVVALTTRITGLPPVTNYFFGRGRQLRVHVFVIG